MKKIVEIEKAIKNETVAELNINNTFYWAYSETQERKNQYLNFNDIIWSDDIDAIMADLKRYGIKTFTISNASTGLRDNLADFCERGCKIAGMVKVKTYKCYSSDKYKIENAIKLQMPR